MVSRVRGAFNDVSGFADIAEDLADSNAEVIIQTASVDTRSADRDTHLRSADFFDVETYPEIRFVSSAIDEVDEGSYIVTGDLTIPVIRRRPSPFRSSSSAWTPTRSATCAPALRVRAASTARTGA